MEISLDLRRIKAAAEKDLLNIEGVTGVGVGEKITAGKRTGIPSIRIYVKKKKPKARLSKGEMIPAEIDGIPTDVIEREFVLHPAKVALTDLQPQVDTTRYGTLTGGTSIGPCRAVGGFIFVGTLGLVVEDNDTGERMMLSNFHVMCIDDGWSVGDTMCQPGRVDGGACPADVVGELARASLGGQVDAAVARITDRTSNCRVTEIGNINGTATAVDGEAVRKRGRTTELTHGFVDDISLTVSIDYEDGLGVVTLSNQIGIEVDTAQSTQFGNSGDSGSVVVNSSGRVIGLYFAGTSDGSYGVANPIDAVLSAMDVRLCATGPVETLPWVDTLQTNPWFDTLQTIPWFDTLQTIPWLDSQGTFKQIDDVKNPAGYDTLMETIQEGMTLQEQGGFTTRENIGGFDPAIPVERPPLNRPPASPFALATPHHAAGAARFEEPQGEVDIDSEISRVQQYLESLEAYKKSGR